MEDSVHDAAHLKSLRLAAGLDLAQLAALVNLSPGQVRQLEEGGGSLFYSAQIKAQSMRRVIRLLEAPAALENKVESAGPPSPRSSSSVIDDIIRLSEKSLNSTVVHSDVRRNKSMLYKLLATAVAAGFFGFFAWQSNQQRSQALYSEWVKPLSSEVSASTAEPVPLVSANEPPPHKADKLTTEAMTPTTVPPVATNSSTATECKNLQSEQVRIANPSLQPSKPGTYVYLVASKAMNICVDDGKRKQTLITLSAGAGRTVHGQSPWTIAAQDLKSIEIYFQGSKVWLPADVGQRILLNEQALAP